MRSNPLGLGQLAMASLAAMGVTIGASGNDVMREETRPSRSPRRSARRAKYGGSIAEANRWTGQPHEHRREIARRLRQQEG